MINLKHFPTAILITATLICCEALTGEEVARLPINEVSTEENLIIKEASVDLHAGDEITIWSEFDVEYSGDPMIIFKIEILYNGAAYGNLDIDPREKDLTFNETQVEVNESTNWSFTGRNGAVTAQQDGTYTFKALLTTSDPTNVKIEKAELVLKKL